ncbi:MAG TPA: YciI family protein [Fimbriimonadaceae bacterium]|nr:YciI family protein [Fimbriimonadaceae bacterium]
MQYLFLVYQEVSKLAGVPDEELRKTVSDCVAYIGELERSGHHVMSSGLQSARTATTVRHEAGRAVTTDGPFAETKEVLGGFTMVEAKDLNEAIQLASRMPTGAYGCVEVRPVMDPAGDVSDPIDARILQAVRSAIGAPSS